LFDVIAQSAGNTRALHDGVPHSHRPVKMPSPKQITVLMAEDHGVVRQGLSSLLVADGRFRIVGEAETGREAVDMARTLRPDVIVMDIAMPKLNGMEATRQILIENPAAKVLILSAHSDDEYIERTITVGVSGFLEKQTSAEVLTKAVGEVAKGNRFFSPGIAKRIADNRNRSLGRDGLPKAGGVRLTSRETEVLQLVAEGKANKQVAAELRISIKTVEKHRQHLMNKLNIHETAGLTRYAIEQRIVEATVQLTIT
jgi:DNA-binding NarL/FixJ family response regulator